MRTTRWALAVGLVLVTMLPAISNAQTTTVLNRQVCLSVPGSGCMRLQLDVAPDASNGGSMVSVLLRNMQVPRYPGDPLWTHMSSLTIALTQRGPLTDFQEGHPEVFTYGNVANLTPEIARDWAWFGQTFVNTTYLQFHLFHPYSDQGPVGLNGCTPGLLNGRPAGARTCDEQGNAGSVMLRLFVPYVFSSTDIRGATLDSYVQEAPNVRGMSSFCSAGRLGTHVLGPGFASCVVSEATDNLAVGELNAIVTPEPATLALLGAGLLGFAPVLRRRRR